MGFGLTEPNAGSDAGASRTKAIKNGDHWILNGSKTFITNASTHITKGTIVQAVTGAKPNGRPSHTCFILENETQGFTTSVMKNKLVRRVSNTANLFFEDCRVYEFPGEDRGESLSGNIRSTRLNSDP